MKNKIYIPFLFLLLMVSCRSKIETSKGKFFQGKTFNNERYFVHDLLQEDNPLIKVFDTINGNSGYGYYSWKTIKTMEELDNKEKISVYNTITNQELKEFKNDKLAYIQKDKNVRINNLYFLDDYRCIYLSFDDIRAVDNENIIPLYFDKKYYKIKKAEKKRFGQYLRGYYTLTGKDLFLHFESPYDPAVNYFVKAKLSADNQTVNFLSMTIPDSPNELYADGYNQDFKAFEAVFHTKAQPIFESVEPVSDLIFIPQNSVSLGFELNSDSNHLNRLHQQLLEKYNTQLKPNDTLVLTKVDYHLETPCKNLNATGIRQYSLKKFGESKATYQIDECIGLDEITNKSQIDTW